MIQPFFAALAAAAWLFISGAILFAVALPHWFQTHFGHIARDKKTLPLWAIIFEKLLQGVGLCLLVLWSNVPIVYLSLIPLLLVTGTYLFSTYATYNVEARPVVWIAVIDGARIEVALAIVGLVLGKGLV
jgi:hypothetical protein